MPRTFLRSIIYVELNDGRRAISGTLACMDNEVNIILHEATEHTLGESNQSERFIPLVMIPGKHIARVATPISDLDPSLYL